MFEKLSLIKETLELIHRFRKIILPFLLVGLVILLLLSVWAVRINREKNNRLVKSWNNIKIGDSVFVKNNVWDLNFYKKGREKLYNYEQKEINYKREDSINFIQQNTVHEKYFYQNNTSFIGICIGKDSSLTKEGEHKSHKWIQIKPSYKISNPPKTNKYDFEARKWENNRKNYSVNGKLSEDFYINFKDIQTSNNDKTFSQ